MFWNKPRPKIHSLGVKKAESLKIHNQAKESNIYKKLKADLHE